MGMKTFARIITAVDEIKKIDVFIIQKQLIELSKYAEWQANKPARIQRIDDLMQHQIQIHMNGWIEKVDEAINSARDPADEESIGYFLLALVGNLVWAFTSLKAVEELGKAVVVSMSIGGSVLGSGTIGKAAMMFQQPAQRRDLLKQEIAKFQGIYEQQFQKSRKGWAEEFDNMRLPPEFAADRIENFIWDKMFPISQADGDKYLRVYLETKANIERILVEFDRAWSEYAISQAVDFNDGERPIDLPDYSKQFDADSALRYVRSQMENVIRSNSR